MCGPDFLRVGLIVLMKNQCLTHGHKEKKKIWRSSNSKNHINQTKNSHKAAAAGITV